MGRPGRAAEAVLDAEAIGHQAQLAPLMVFDQRDADAGAAGAAGAPHAVHVGVVIVGRIEVDHVRDAADVDASGGDVGGHQRVDRAALKASQRDLALALGLVAVHRHRADASGVQALDQAVGAALGAHEHERQVPFGLQLGDERFDAPLA